MTKGRPAQLGDRRLSPNGYLYERRADGWVLLHRAIVEESLGRKLLPTERIRFKDNNRENVTLDNLRVINVKPKSPAKERAIIESKIDQLRARLEELE